MTGPLVGIDGQGVVLSFRDACGKFLGYLGWLQLMEGHVGLLNGHEHLGGPPEVDSAGHIRVVLGEIKGHRCRRIEVREACGVREEPLGHDSHALAMTTDHCLVHLRGPLLGSREQHAALGSRLGTHGFLTEECNERRGINGSDGRPVGETEAVDCRIETVIDAVRRIDPRAVREHVARSVSCRLAVAARKRNRRGGCARSARGEQQNCGYRWSRGPSAES